MKKKKAWIYGVPAAVVVLGAGLGTYIYQSQMSGSPITVMSVDGKTTSIAELVARPTPNAKIDRYTLVAQRNTITLGTGRTIQALTFNGSAPGPLITVTQGDLVQVTVKNNLDMPITVHWHGISVTGAEDGVPGITQDPIKPGSTYVYSFIAKDAGTYWYHSHVDSTTEVGRGLFGGIVVRPATHNDAQPNKDYTLLMHEWSTTATGGMDHMDMGSMNMGSAVLHTSGFQVTNADRQSLNEMSNMYDIYSINRDASGETLLNAEPGETVRLRLVNTGNMTHLMTLAGAPFKVVAIDGHDITDPKPVQGELLPIGAGERYDVEFRMPSTKNVRLISGDSSVIAQRGLQGTIGTFERGMSATVPNVVNEPWFDFTKYGSTSTKSEFTMQTHFDKTFNMSLGAGMQGMNMVYTINGKTFDHSSPFVVDTGDSVKIHIENSSRYIHPIHLHGHYFQVLTRDGHPITGSPIYLDTVDVFPGETYDIAFKADNPGLWMLHCHDLHHSAAGMSMILEYAGITTPYNMKDMNE